METLNNKATDIALRNALIVLARLAADAFPPPCSAVRSDAEIVLDATLNMAYEQEATTSDSDVWHNNSTYLPEQLSCDWDVYAPNEDVYFALGDLVLRAAAESFIARHGSDWDDELVQRGVAYIDDRAGFKNTPAGKHMVGVRARLRANRIAACDMCQDDEDAYIPRPTDALVSAYRRLAADSGVTLRQLEIELEEAIDKQD